MKLKLDIRPFFEKIPRLCERWKVGGYPARIRRNDDDNLLQLDIEHCILLGSFSERQWDTEWDEWKYVIVGEAQDGRAIEVVLKPGKGLNAVVITTYIL